MLIDLCLKKNRSGFREGAPTGRETAVWMWNPSSRGKKPTTAMPNIFIMSQPVFGVIANHTEGTLSRDLWVFPVLVSRGLWLYSKHAQSWFIACLCYIFLNLKLQRLLKYNKTHRRATRMTNSTHRCTRNQCTLVKTPSQSADLSPAKWRAPSCEVDSFALVTWQTDSRVAPPWSYLPVFMPLNNRFPPVQAGQAIWFLSKWLCQPQQWDCHFLITFHKIEYFSYAEQRIPEGLLPLEQDATSWLAWWRRLQGSNLRASLNQQW